jgi:hypothetical protein
MWTFSAGVGRRNAPCETDARRLDDDRDLLDPPSARSKADVRLERLAMIRALWD